MILINGFGRMGQCLAKVLDDEGEQWQAVDSHAAEMALQTSDIVLHDKLDEVEQKPAVLIDFSANTALHDLLDYCVNRRVPLVLATTGYTPEQMECIRQSSVCIPIFADSNMSFAVAALTRCAVRLVKTMPKCCIRIEEYHHLGKKDAPSGTALRMAESIRRCCRPSARIVTYPSVDPNDIAIGSVRQGNEIGLHRIYLTEDWQQIVLQHQAYDRRLFALGAYRAGCMLLHKKNGLYDCTDMLVDERCDG